jgi:hypothetical protein
MVRWLCITLLVAGRGVASASDGAAAGVGVSPSEGEGELTVRPLLGAGVFALDSGVAPFALDAGLRIERVLVLYSGWWGMTAPDSQPPNRSETMSFHAVKVGYQHPLGTWAEVHALAGVGQARYEDRLGAASRGAAATFEAGLGMIGGRTGLRFLTVGVGGFFPTGGPVGQSLARRSAVFTLTLDVIGVLACTAVHAC